MRWRRLDIYILVEPLLTATFIVLLLTTCMVLLPLALAPMGR